MPKLLPLCLLLLSLAAPTHALDSRPSEIYGLSFETPDGTPYPLSRHRGEVLLVNFWATWCPPCVKEMPELDRLNQAFAGQAFSVLAISAGESAADIEAFNRRLEAPLSLQVLLDSDGRTFTEFNLKGLPMSYLFNRKGELVEVITGAEEWAGEAWQRRIKELLAAAP